MTTTQVIRTDSRQGTTLLELMVAMFVFSIIVVGILPVLHQASVSDLGAKSTTNGTYVAAEIMELLMMYRSIETEGGTIPADLAGFAVSEDPYPVEGTGTWAALNIDPDHYEIDYTLSTDANTGKLLARVSVTSLDALVSQGGGARWVEFTSGIE